MSDLSHFPESQFLPSPRRAQAYRELVQAGKKAMKNLRVVVTGLARNIAPVIGKTMARIERTGKMFGDYRVIVFENDSRDNTAEQLRSWSKINKRVQAISESRNDPINPGVRCLDRATRMALYRNKCREIIAEQYADFDSVIVIDLDISGGWSYDGLANTFAQKDWDFVGSNGIIYKDYDGVLNRPLYYDAWAWRWHGSWNPVFARQINPRYWPRGEPMVRVNSCFGGLGVYRTQAMVMSEYDGSDCEHIPFHKRMVEAGMNRLFMNPSQIVLY
jgi:hypothetical protein